VCVCMWMDDTAALYPSYASFSLPFYLSLSHYVGEQVSDRPHAVWPPSSNAVCRGEGPCCEGSSLSIPHRSKHGDGGSLRRRLTRLHRLKLLHASHGGVLSATSERVVSPAWRCSARPQSMGRSYSSIVIRTCVWRDSFRAFRASAFDHCFVVCT